MGVNTEDGSKMKRKGKLHLALGAIAVVLIAAMAVLVIMNAGKPYEKAAVQFFEAANNKDYDLLQEVSTTYIYDFIGSLRDGADLSATEIEVVGSEKFDIFSIIDPSVDEEYATQLGIIDAKGCYQVHLNVRSSGEEYELYHVLVIKVDGKYKVCWLESESDYEEQ